MHTVFDGEGFEDPFGGFLRVVCGEFAFSFLEGLCFEKRRELVRVYVFYFLLVREGGLVFCLLKFEFVLVWCLDLGFVF